MFDTFQSTCLPGYCTCGSLVISYRFPNGKQGPDHPHPGKPYQGTNQTAFLPDNKEGRKVLRLLRKAFNQKLTFTIGQSTTTGRDDCVIWNGIPHKTNMIGTPNWYFKPSFVINLELWNIQYCCFPTKPNTKLLASQNYYNYLLIRWVIVSHSNCFFICISVVATLIQITWRESRTSWRQKESQNKQVELNNLVFKHRRS